MAVQNCSLSDAIDAYLLHRTAQGLAENTVKSNGVCLGRLLEHFGNIQVRSIQVHHVDAFFAAQVGRWSPGSMNLYRTHLSTFFKFCRARQWAGRDVNPLENTRNQKVTRRASMRIPVTEFDRTLDLAEHPRDRMVIALGLFLFLRAGEMSALKLSAVDFDNRELTVEVFKSKLVDPMPMSKNIRRELNRWLTFYTEQVGPLSPEMYLAPALKPHPGVPDPVTGKIRGVSLEGAKINSFRPLGNPAAVVTRVLTRMGESTYREGIHTLRRSGARALFDELADTGYDRALEAVSTMLHHQNMSTTQIYLGLNESRVRRDELLKGKEMFRSTGPATVIPLHSASGK